MTQMQTIKIQSNRYIKGSTEFEICNFGFFFKGQRTFFFFLAKRDENQMEVFKAKDSFFNQCLLIEKW